MSIDVMSWVWAHSESTGNDRLVLLAIADHASDDGTNAYPSVARLSVKTRASERTVQRSIQSLIRLGELHVEWGTGRSTSRYTVVMDASDGCHSDTRQDDTPGASDTTSRGDTVGTQTFKEPSTNHPEPSSSAPAATDDERPGIDDEPSEDVVRLCELLADLVAENGSKRPTVTKRWYAAARLLTTTDGRSVENVEKAIRWCQADEFWRGNVMAMPKLREKYDQLRLAAQRRGTGAEARRERGLDVVEQLTREDQLTGATS